MNNSYVLFNVEYESDVAILYCICSVTMVLHFITILYVHILVANILRDCVTRFQGAKFGIKGILQHAEAHFSQISWRTCFRRGPKTLAAL